MTSHKFRKVASKDEDVYFFEFPNRESPEALKVISFLGENLETAAGSPFPRVSHWRELHTTKWKQVKAYKDELVLERLDDAKARLLNSENAEDEMKCATDHIVFREQQAAIKEDREPQHDTPGAKDELVLFLLAGHEKTSNAIKKAITYLTQHPSFQIKLRTNLHSTFERGQRSDIVPSGGAIAKACIPYMDAFIEEVLGHAVLIAAQVRVALHDTELLRHQIRKSIDVVTMSCGPGFRRPDPFVSRIAETDRSKTSQASKGAVPHWSSENFTEFKPDRWIKGTQSDPQAGPSRQFGAGDRGCSGRELACLELRIVLTIILRSSELAPLPEALISHASLAKPAREPIQRYIRPIPLPLACP
ncbi:cytochrome P450 [Myriangium duriaei CBS 260.36]|uniref:Cytochrome P450 n=1 Tax=Myriangium duriaei CBS 260.36 TaxID=1168546 RepID=A0A9P4IUF0_9PEZI|nr:cytochrome P450 [Myriangium duriaei CBS 260.36]